MSSRTRRETSFASGKRTLRSEERSMPRLGIAIVLVVLAAFGLSGAVASAAEPPPDCTSSGPNICADIVGDPATVSPSKLDEPPHFVTYSSTVANVGPESASHVTADLKLTGGLVLVSATPSGGSCSVNAGPEIGRASCRERV